MKRNLAVLTAVLTAAAGVAGIAVAASTPAVVTGPSSAISDTTVDLHGSVTPDGSSTTYYFQYGLSVTYGLQSASHSAGSGTKAVAVKATASGLIPGTTYHYRLVAGNRYGTAIGNDRTFTTTGHPPAVVVTGPVFAVGRDFAIPTGTINPEGEATGWAFQYGTTSAYGVQTFGGRLPPANTATQVHETLSGLSNGTTFHYRLIAVHGGTVVSYGADQTFTTFPSPRRVAVVRARTTPRHASTKPYLFTTSGRVVPPASIPASVSCNGLVAVRFFLGRHVRALVFASVKPDCTYSTQKLFRKRIGRHSTTLRVQVHFRGNSYLAPADARAQKVDLG